MFRLKRKVVDTAELVVYPKPVPIRKDQLTGGAGEAGTTIVSGKAAPRGDFAGVRDYRIGDELKRVHWKTTARTQKLAVIECEDSVQQSVTIALDLSRGADFGKGTVTSLDTATGAAAYAIRGYLKAGRDVHVVIPNGAKSTACVLTVSTSCPWRLPRSLEPRPIRQ
jgi:uncharacterized protein (DUF58 family)